MPVKRRRKVVRRYSHCYCREITLDVGNAVRAVRLDAAVWPAAGV
jgi:hypothetical protein